MDVAEDAPEDTQMPKCNLRFKPMGLLNLGGGSAGRAEAGGVVNDRLALNHLVNILFAASSSADAQASPFCIVLCETNR